MYIYLISTLITGIFLYFSEFFYKRKKENSKNYYLYIFFFVLAIIPYFFVSGFRYGVGTDYFYTYFPRFYQIMGGSNGYTEFLFTGLNKFILLFTDEAQWLFIITSFIFVLFMMLSIKKMTHHWYIGGILLLLSNVYLISLSNIRQYLAISIGIYALSFACDRKYIQLIVFGTLSVLFHYTAVCMIPIYIIGLVSKFPKFKKYAFFFLIVIIALSPTYIPLTKAILKNTRYIKYFEITGCPRSLYFYLIPSAITLLIALVFYKKVSSYNQYTFTLLVCLTLATIIGILSIFNPIVETMSRACNWYYWSIIFIVPMFLDLFKQKWIGILITISLILIISSSTYYLIVVLGHHEVLPYRFFFWKDHFIY